jgi:hypothetical protein
MPQNLDIPLVVTSKNFSIALVGLKLADLIKNPRPILINAQGSYAWVSGMQVRNAIRILNSKERAAKSNCVPFAPKIEFKNPIPINNHAVQKSLAKAVVEMDRLMRAGK